MNAIGSAVTAPLKLLGIIPKASQQPALPAPLPSATRDDARTMIMTDDALRRRRGGAADILTGAGGAAVASGTTGKASLGS